MRTVRRTLAVASVGVAGVLVAGTFAVALGRSAAPPPADRSEHFDAAVPLPPITVATPFNQTVVAREDGLSAIDVRFATYLGATRCSVRAVVADSAGASLSDRVLPCAGLRDGLPSAVARFAPQPGSEGRTYRVTLSAQGPSEQAVAVWGVAPTPGLPRARSGDAAQLLAGEVTTGYGAESPAWRQVPEALRRMTEHRPAYARPATVVAGVVAAVALLLVVAWGGGRAAVVALLALTAVKGLLWAVVLPPLKGPDEEAHFAYAQFLAEQHRVPDRDTPVSGLPTYSPELVDAVRVLHVESRPPGDRPDFGQGAAVFRTEASRRSNGAGAAAGYPPAYYLPAAVLDALAPGPLPVRLGYVRLWGVALGVGATWVALAVGRRLFPGSPAAALALATAVALQPMFSQQTAALNNDAMVILGGFLCLLVAVELARPGAPRRLELLAGAALGTALLGKPFGAVLAPVLALAWLVGWRRTPARRRRDWARAALLGGAGLAATYGAWALAARALGLPPTSLTDVTVTAGPRGLRSYLALLRRDGMESLETTWVDRFWGSFAWLDALLPSWAYGVLRALNVVVLVLVGAWAAQRVGRAVLRRSRHRRVGARAVGGTAGMTGTWLCLAAVASTVLLLHAVEYRWFANTGRADLLQGRYALPVLPAVLALPALLLRRLVPRVPTPVVAWSTAAFVGALHALSLGTLVDRFYL